ncbi:MAG: LysE family transporter [Anaerolineae bacterium]|nr:LysE family transporter [Anaerolineae bacterium]
MRGRAGIFWSALAVGFSGAMIPGPMLAVVLSESLNGRLWGSLGVVLGHVLLEAALLVALAQGAGGVLKKPAVGAVVGIVGGALLAYMGASVVHTVLRDPGAMVANASLVSLPASPVVTGVLVSGSNPAWVMWWGAVGVGYVALALGQGRGGLLSFYVGHTLSDWVWYGAVAGLVTSGRQMLQGKPYLWLISICGVLLVGFGLYFVSLGVRQVRQRQAAAAVRVREA